MAIRDRSSVHNSFVAIKSIKPDGGPHMCWPDGSTQPFVKPTMMKKHQGNGEESFEELQELFEELFQGDIDTFGSSSRGTSTSCSGLSSSYTSLSGSSGSNNKRSSSEMNFGKNNLEGTSGFDTNFQSFCFGTGGTPTNCQKGEGSKRSSGRNRR